jgi:MFS family permease
MSASALAPTDGARTPTAPAGAAAREPLFTPRFFVMCCFTFTVFLSAFALLPTAPFHILDLGGSPATAGLFLGFLTYSSAFSAPFTGALADRTGKRPMLVACSLALGGFGVAYALVPSAAPMLALVLVHGVFWSALISASSAYMTDFIPESRRAEGIGYWGLSSVAALMLAPAAGLRLYRHGWAALCLATAALSLLMAAIAWRLPETDVAARFSAARGLGGGLIEWRVLRVAFTLFLCSFGYGGITSFAALYAQASGVAPRGIYFICLALGIVAVRPIAGPLADRVSPRRVLVPCLLVACAGLTVLAVGSGRSAFVVSALLFGLGFGSLHPVLATHVLRHVGAERRGAAFGAILAAFDTGIGTGSIVTGLLVQRFGYALAFGVAASLAALAAPYFLVTDRRLTP